MYISWNDFNVEILWKTRADVHVTSWLSDLLLDVLLWQDEQKYQLQGKQQMVGNRQQLPLQKKRKGKQQQKQKQKQQQQPQ